MGPTTLEREHPPWWRSAVIYEVYVRSFGDGNGDGIGDLAGVRSHLDYLADLGVDAIWLTPFYPSPLADGGYDVVDYRAVDPVFGDLGEAERLIAEAAARGIKTIVDVVPNHVSVEHPWFREALDAGPGSAARRRFWFREGRGEHHELTPNDWTSEFGGSAWTRTTDADGTPGEWYLHLFTPDQPDLNWNSPEVVAEHLAVLRFWFDRGAAGVRIDSAALLVKDPGLPDVAASPPGERPFVDRDELHEVYRAWRAVADSYAATAGGPRVLIGEVWLEDPKRFAAYLRPDELHSAFNFDLMVRPFDAKELRESIQTTLAVHEPVAAPATWVLSNHDVTRPVTRYGRRESNFSFPAKRFDTPTDLALGTARARAAALLVAALPGALYVFQGDELGLPEVELPRDAIVDPMHARSGGVDPGRDGCRVPIPWTAAGPGLGFSGAGEVAPWLPQPKAFAALAVEIQSGEQSSMLTLYRRALHLRRTLPALAEESLAWVELGEGLLAFTRGGQASGAHTLTCVLNASGNAAPLPAGDLLLASAPTVDGVLPANACAWLSP